MDLFVIRSRQKHIALCIVIALTLIGCQKQGTSPMLSVLTTTSPVNTPAAELSATVSPTVAPPEATTNYSVPIIPTPGENTGVVHGILVDSKAMPLAGLPVYLGTFDGMLAEVSLNTSPKTITDGSGVFIFPEIPPNDDSFQYVVGIIMANSATIIKIPNDTRMLVFNVQAGAVVDLGTVFSDF